MYMISVRATRANLSDQDQAYKTRTRPKPNLLHHDSIKTGESRKHNGKRKHKARCSCHTNTSVIQIPKHEILVSVINMSSTYLSMTRTYLRPRLRAVLQD